MNTQLLKRCGITAEITNRRALRCEALTVNSFKTERLMDYVKSHHRGFNYGMVRSIKAYRITYKRKPTGIVKVFYDQVCCGLAIWLPEADYNVI